MSAGTAETVVQIEVTKGGVEIVEPHQAHDPATEPDAFGVSRRAIDDLGGFDELVGLVLVGFLGGVGRRRPDWPLPLCRAVPGGARRRSGRRQFRRRSGAQTRRRRGGAKPHFEARSTRRRINSPICFLLVAWPRPALAGLMPFKWVSNAAETLPDSHDGHFRFCPANSQLYRVVVKPRTQFRPGPLGSAPVTG